jgi:predicted phosphodiesterase
MDWTKKELIKIYELKKQGKEWKEIAREVKKSPKAVIRKYGRTNWEKFLQDPDKQCNTGSKKWNNEEMIQLDSYLQAGSSYPFIAEKLGRSIISVERQAQSTDWKAWREISGVTSSGDNTDIDNEALLSNLINALLHVCDNNFDAINNIKLDSFASKVNLDKSKLLIPFTDLKEKAKQRLVEFGLGNPESVELGEGTYVIVGDSHGKYTKKDMFKLLEQVNKTLKPTNIIHIGHILDDEKDISYEWGMFKNLIIVAREEELKIIQDQRNKYNFSYSIVTDRASIGELLIINQELISDYVKTSIASLDIGERVILACHRLEVATKCTSADSLYYASPGCLCERHIVKAIKQIDFSDGKVIKEARSEGFTKYRRMGYMSKYWEQGLIVIQVDKDLNHTIVTCPIKKTSKGYTTSYFDKIITSNGVFKPDKKIFVIGDMHCDKHDINVLDIEEQICKDYNADICVNLGDTLNYSSLNHHVMDRGGVIMDKKILDESAQTYYILDRVAKWTKDNYILTGNHERFAADYTQKFPQFGEMLGFNFMCDLEHLGYKLTPIKSVLKIGSVSFIHGEIRMYGQSGSKMDKTAKTFGKKVVFIGHIHRPEVRFSCYSVGLSGELDQGYNESASASNWVHGFGTCNIFKGEPFPASIAIVDNRCILGNKVYEPKDLDSWKMPKYKARMTYGFEK